MYLDKRNISEIPYQTQFVTCSFPLPKQRQQQLIRKHKSSSELNAGIQLKRLKLSLETSNQTLLRLEKHRAEVKLHRNNQSSEQIMLRLQKHQIRKKNQQQQETQQQRSNRLERQRRSTQKCRRKLNNMGHYKQTKKSLLSLDQNIQQFKANINNGPYFICVICSRMLYKVSVQQFMEDKHSDISKTIAQKVKSYGKSKQ